MKLYCIIALSLLLRPETATAQQEESITLSLQQAIEIAQENSPEAQAARHTYRAAYWNYRFFRANYLPSVTLTSSPTLNREINKITQPDGTNQFIQQDQLSTDLSLKINQNIWFTGGSVSVPESGTGNCGSVCKATDGYYYFPDRNCDCFAIYDCDCTLH